MIDWFHFDNFSGFVYIIFIVVGLKYIIEAVNKANVTSTTTCDTTSGPTNCTIPDTDEDIPINIVEESSSDDVVLEIQREDLYNTIIAIRKLQDTMRNIQNV